MKQTVYNLKTSESIEIELNLDINRELTEEEKDLISACMEKIHFMIRLTNVTTSREFIEECKLERENIINLFPKPICVKEIPNEYNPLYPLPWFLVTTTKGVIKIGWRKRVLSIDWNESDIEGDSEDFFPDEDVTKIRKLIHAWSYEKAEEYITKLLS